MGSEGRSWVHKARLIRSFLLDLGHAASNRRAAFLSLTLESEELRLIPSQAGRNFLSARAPSGRWRHGTRDRGPAKRHLRMIAEIALAAAHQLFTGRGRSARNQACSQRKVGL